MFSHRTGKYVCSEDREDMLLLVPESIVGACQEDKKHLLWYMDDMSNLAYYIVHALEQHTHHKLNPCSLAFSLPSLHDSDSSGAVIMSPNPFGNAVIHQVGYGPS